MSNLNFPEYRRINGDCTDNYRTLINIFGATTTSFSGLQFRCLGPIPKYTVVSDQNKNPFEEGWYERSTETLVTPAPERGIEGVFIYTYFKTVDTSVDIEKTYYKQQEYPSSQLFCLGLKASIPEEEGALPDQCVLCYVPIGNASKEN